MNDSHTEETLGLPSASSMDRYWHCPGSFTAEQGLPPLPEQTVTEEGTAIHEAMESGDLEALDEEPRRIAERLKDMEDKALAEWRLLMGISRTYRAEREFRLWLRDPKTNEPICSAKPDLVVLNEDRDNGAAFVLDYKTGFKVVTGTELNWQSRAQVIAVRRNYPFLRHIRGAILSSRFSSKLDVTDYEVADLNQIEYEIRHTVWRTKQEGAPRVPGTWCRYCRAQGLCRENVVYSTIVAAFLKSRALPPGPKEAVQLKCLEEARYMTAHDMAYVMDRKPALTFCLEMISQKMKALPADRLAEVGYRVVEGSKTYPIPTDQNSRVFTDLVRMFDDKGAFLCLKFSLGAMILMLRMRDAAISSYDEARSKIVAKLGLVQKVGEPRLRRIE